MEKLCPLPSYVKGADLAFYFLETSALVKLYVREQGTESLLSLVSQSDGNEFGLLALAQVEFRSAVRRRERAGDISSKVVGLLLDRFERHMLGMFEMQAADDTVIHTALGLVDRHVLRAYDALQLAACLVLTQRSRMSPIFACADKRLLEAAKSEKLPVYDPCSQI